MSKCAIRNQRLSSLGCMRYRRNFAGPRGILSTGSSITGTSFTHFSSDTNHVHFLQIRIVKNPYEKNPKKQHRGYAFIVYEREKDMKGNYILPVPFVTSQSMLEYC
jgi:hypothetical protein